MTDTDPFMANANIPERRPGDFRRDSKGTPFVSDPTGACVKPKRKADAPRVKLVRYSRPSSFGKQIENSYNLAKWSERQVLLGIAIGLGEEAGERARRLVPANQDDKEWRKEADSLVRLAKDVAKAGLAADRGTHTHAITEDDDADRDWITRAEAGEILGLPIEVQQGLVEAWRLMLAEYGLEVLASELPVVHDKYRCAGTLDRIVRLTRDLTFVLGDGTECTIDAGTVLVLDIKSGKLRHQNGLIAYWRGHPIQIAIYAGGTGYDTDTDTRRPLEWDVDQTWALIAHLDVLSALDGEARCALIAVDLNAGRAGADLVLAAHWYEGNDAMFSLADAHHVGVPIVQPAGDSPTSEAPATGNEPLAAQHPIADRIANLRERCRVAASLHPQAAQLLLDNFTSSLIDLRNPDLTVAEVDWAQQIVETAETVANAPWADLPTASRNRYAVV